MNPLPYHLHSKEFISPCVILLTTTSFQDTPGPHHDYLAKSGLEIVRARGPLQEDAMLKLIAGHGGFDGLLNGDDLITAKVIDAALNAPTRLRVIAKYGIGLDSIDVKHATALKIPVLFTPGVITPRCGTYLSADDRAGQAVLAHIKSTKEGGWKRITGHELYGKSIAVLGVGRIGKEVIKRAAAFDMKCIGFDKYWDDAFASQFNVTRAASADEAIKSADVVSLHMNLDDSNRGFINSTRIATMKKGAWIINTARGGWWWKRMWQRRAKAAYLGGYASRCAG
ncbi:MAG: 3-phosphoglycerate dehydrogenase [Phycisphaerales bacterium]|nr:3-phosphoglycerate dehydrogenase [Phycisphaerales bacterium]